MSLTNFETWLRQKQLITAADTQEVVDRKIKSFKRKYKVPTMRAVGPTIMAEESELNRRHSEVLADALKTSENRREKLLENSPRMLAIKKAKAAARQAAEEALRKAGKKKTDEQLEASPAMPGTPETPHEEPKSSTTSHPKTPKAPKRTN